MKKITAIIMITLICCTLIVGCSSASKENESLTVYSFSGENDQLSISNGVIILNNTEEIYYGGTLSTKEGNFSDITVFTDSLYVNDRSERRILFTNSVVDETGGTIIVSHETGKISGDILNNEEEIDWENNLYYELKTTNLNGEEEIYQLQLALTEITASKTK